MGFADAEIVTGGKAQIFLWQNTVGAGNGRVSFTKSAIQGFEILQVCTASSSQIWAQLQYLVQISQ